MTGTPTYVNNGGLVLFGVFLPQLFTELQLLDTGDEGRTSAMRDWDSSSRAVQLLQYLVDGTTGKIEQTLALNKILCGLHPSQTVAPSINAANEEVAAADRLLRSVLVNWEAVSGTSIAGLRETFLQREARLLETPEGWRLRVDRKTVDVLVDQIPWSTSVVYHRWMEQPIMVEW